MQPIAAQVISKQVSTSHPPYIPYFIKEKEWNKTRPIWTRNADDVSTMSTLGKSQGEMGLQLIVFKSKIIQEIKGLVGPVQADDGDTTSLSSSSVLPELEARVEADKYSLPFELACRSKTPALLSSPWRFSRLYSQSLQASMWRLIALIMASIWILSHSVFNL